jgi:hypothetical protein
MTQKPEQLSDLRASIRQILMSKWDPIGVSDTAEAADEYDGYIEGILELLDRKATVQQLSDHLCKIETKRMELVDHNGISLVSSERRNTAARELKALASTSAQALSKTQGKKYTHWTRFTKLISPAFAKTQERRRLGLCIGCGSDPCKCKNPRTQQ